jgi:hypothetical protein
MCAEYVTTDSPFNSLDSQTTSRSSRKAQHSVLQLLTLFQALKPALWLEDFCVVEHLVVGMITVHAVGYTCSRRNVLAAERCARRWHNSWNSSRHAIRQPQRLFDHSTEVWNAFQSCPINHLVLVRNGRSKFSLESFPDLGVMQDAPGCLHESIGSRLSPGGPHQHSIAREADV